MQRIKATAIIPPNGISQRQPLAAEGYKPTATARFGVVRANKDAPWVLTHLATGCGVGSLLPVKSRKLTLTDMLSVAAAGEAQTHLDWSMLDSLPVTTMGTKESPRIVCPNRETLDAMRQLAAQVIA